MESKIEQFLTLELTALERQIQLLRDRQAYVNELLHYARTQISAPESSPSYLNGATLYQDVMNILKNNPGKEYGATALIAELSPKWQESEAVTHGKQKFEKRVWGVMNYIRKTKKTKIVRRGNRSYLIWEGAK